MLGFKFKLQSRIKSLACIKIYGWLHSVNSPIIDGLRISGPLVISHLGTEIIEPGGRKPRNLFCSADILFISAVHFGDHQINFVSDNQLFILNILWMERLAVTAPGSKEFNHGVALRYFGFEVFGDVHHSHAAKL